MHKWSPADYEKSSSAQYKWAIHLLNGLYLAGDEKVLDIGCGDGKISAEIAARVNQGSVLGIDSSQDMIDYARSRYPAERHPNLAFRWGDASHLDFNHEFDLVVSFACLHWVKDHVAVLKGIRDSLRSSGRFLLQCGGRGNAGEILALTEELIRETKWSKYFHNFSFPYYFYGPDEYFAWLEIAGLKAKRVELVPKDMVHTGKTGLEAIIRNTWLPYIERIPEELQSSFISEIADRYVKRYPIKDGLVHVKMVRLEVEA